MTHAILLQGKKFGKWKVLNKPAITNKSQGWRWQCQCECGTKRIVRSSDLRKGISTSCGCALRLPLGESACRWLFRNYRNQSRGLGFELTLEEFKKITKQDCYYCKNKPMNIIDRSSARCNGVYVYNGIDRIDNSKGYAIENVVPCCKICNSMKGKLSQKDFYKHIKRILIFENKEEE